MVLGIPPEVVLEQAGHRDYRRQRREELETRIGALEYRYARLMAELERMEGEIDETRQQLALLEEQEATLEHPADVALGVLRSVDLPEETRFDLERRLGTALMKWGPREMPEGETSSASPRTTKNDAGDV